MEPALIGVFGTVLGVISAGVLSHSRDKANRKHALELKKVELDEAKQQRLRDDRIKAYTKFARQTSGKDALDKVTNEELWDSYTEIQIIGGSQEVASAALSLYTAATRLKDMNNAPHDYDNHTFSEIINSVFAAKTEFMKVARADIGHPPEAQEMRL